MKERKWVVGIRIGVKRRKLELGGSGKSSDLGSQRERNKIVENGFKSTSPSPSYINISCVIVEIG